jgi:hypothetical protein
LNIYNFDTDYIELIDERKLYNFHNCYHQNEFLENNFNSMKEMNFYIPVLISSQTLHNRLGIPRDDSSRIRFVVCCCICIKGDELVDLRFDLNLISSNNSLFTICSSSSFDGRFNLE